MTIQKVGRIWKAETFFLTSTILFKYIPFARNNYINFHKFIFRAKFAEKEYEGIKSYSKEDFKKEKVADIVMKSVTEKSETFKIHYDQIK